MTNVLQKVDIATIKEGAKVIPQLPDSWKGKLEYLLNGKEGEVRRVESGVVDVHYPGKGYCSDIPIEYLFLAPESKPVLQKADIASLKKGDEVLLNADDWVTDELPYWHNKIAKVVNAKCSPLKITIDGKPDEIHSDWVYAPPLRPIDLTTIKEGIPVVIQSEGSEWDKRKGTYIGRAESSQYVWLLIDEIECYFPASIVFHSPEQPAATSAEGLQRLEKEIDDLLEKETWEHIKPAPIPGKPFEVGEEVVTTATATDPVAKDKCSGKSGKITDVFYGERYLQENKYKVHGYWWPASALERVSVKQQQPIHPRQLTEEEYQNLTIGEYFQVRDIPAWHHWFDVNEGSTVSFLNWAEYGNKSVLVQLLNSHQTTEIPWKCLYHPTTPISVKQEQPVLIELEKAVDWLIGYGFEKAADSIRVFSEENQYHLPQPEEQSASPEAMLQAVGRLSVLSEPILDDSDIKAWEKLKQEERTNKVDCTVSFTPGQWDN